VQDGSPSAKGGVTIGDQIVAVDGELMIDKTLAMSCTSCAAVSASRSR
jgi:C-terminal processing protease CtpA/Prc